MQYSIKGLIFDLDGVIVDTAKYHFLAWKKVAESLGGSLSEEENELLKGVSRKDSLEEILKMNNLSITPDEKAKLLIAKNEDYLDLITDMSQDELLPGVKAFIKSAIDLGLRIGLGSASKNARIILEQTKLTPYFHTIVDGTDVTKSKPNPEVFIKGASRLGLKPQELIVFEDSVKGLQAAKSSGFKTVGVGKHPLEYAERMIESFENLKVEDFIH